MNNKRRAEEENSADRNLIVIAKHIKENQTQME